MVVAVGAVVSGLTALASNEAVQAGAVRLARDVYSRIMPGRNELVDANKGNVIGQAVAPFEPGVSRDEMVAAMAMLQAQLQEAVVNATVLAEQGADRRHRVLVLGLGAVGLLQLGLMGALMLG